MATACMSQIGYRTAKTIQHILTPNVQHVQIDDNHNAHHGEQDDLGSHEIQPKQFPDICHG